MPERALAALHIGVDGRELLGKPTGVGRYLRHVLDTWRASATFTHRVTIFLPSAPPPALVDALQPMTWAVVPHADGGTWWEQTKLPGAIARSGIDVFFAAGYTAPLRMPCPFVLAVYDVSFFAHPEWFSTREGMRRRWLTRRASRNARSVVTISEFSAAEIVRWIGIDRGRIRMAPPGAPPLMAAATTARQPVVLFVGSVFNRRHVPELIQAFARARQRVPNARLVIVGDNRTSPHIDLRAVARGAGADAAVNWREYVDDATLAALYGTARVFAFLSDYEGFAMTPMEALAHGVPSVLLDTPVAREVYGDGALRVPLDVPAIADALAALLADDDARARVLAAGRERMATYSWTHAAAVIRDALEEAAR